MHLSDYNDADLVPEHKARAKRFDKSERLWGWIAGVALLSLIAIVMVSGISQGEPPAIASKAAQINPPQSVESARIAPQATSSERETTGASPRD